MTDEMLRDVLEHRARRADPSAADDPDVVVAMVRERAERRHRTRRNATAAAGGVAVVAAMVVGAVVLPSSGHHSAGDPAGGPGDASSASRPHVSTAQSAAARSAAQAAASAASAARSRAAASSSAAARPVTALVPVVTPTSAAVAVGRIPVAWRYTGHSGPVTFYGPDSLPLNDNPDFASVIVVDVHERVKPDGPNDLIIAGSKGRYHTDGGVQMVSALVNATTEMDVQIPVGARTTRAQALAIADSLVLRSAAQKTHG